MRKILLPILVLLLTVVSMTASAQETDPASSEGCIAFGEYITTGTTTTIDLPAGDFLAGEQVAFFVEVSGTANGTEEYSLIDDSGPATLAGPVAVGETLYYTIPADGTYDFSMELTNFDVAGQVTAICASGSTPDLEDLDPDGDGKVEICHFPGGNTSKAHSITVGLPAVSAHMRNHGDTIGECPEGLDSRVDDDDSGVIFFIDEDEGAIDIYGNCDEDGCSILATIIVSDLEAVEDFEVEYADDESDFSVIVYYLHEFPEDGADTGIYVFQLNVYDDGELKSDDLLLLVNDEGEILAWTSHDMWNRLEEFTGAFELDD